jgi:NAD(P)H-hydrate epimerase
VKIVSVAQMRRLEEECARYGISTDDLMERAGLAVAREARAMMGGGAVGRALVLVGPGNNGGDGLVAARHLSMQRAQVVAYIVTKRPEGDAKLESARQARVDVVGPWEDEALSALDGLMRESHIIIDAVLGTGRARALEGAVREVMLKLGPYRDKLLALDLPTGVDADTGAVDAATPSAGMTVCLGFPKRGLLEFPAAEKVGKLRVVDIGIPAELAKDIKLELITPEFVREKLPKRPMGGHKGTFGHTLIIGGSINYPGAACMATESALRSGVGLVTLASPERLYSIVASKLTEAIHLPLPDGGRGVLTPEAVKAVAEAMEQYDAVGLGCGMGRSEEARGFMEVVLESGVLTKPLVIDADGLNLLSGIKDWHKKLKGPVVLTPHPGEMARLTGLSIKDVQAKRVEVAREWSGKWGVVVALKGAFTVAASPEGIVRVSPFANPLLASGGTGDVLTGLVAGLLAQGMSASEAAACGVYVHGASAEGLREEFGDRGMLAGDLVGRIPEAVRGILG